MTRCPHLEQNRALERSSVPHLPHQRLSSSTAPPPPPFLLSVGAPPPAAKGLGAPGPRCPARLRGCVYEGKSSYRNCKSFFAEDLHVYGVLSFRIFWRAGPFTRGPRERAAESVVRRGLAGARGGRTARGTREARLRWPGRRRRSGDCVRPPSLAYALVIGDIGGAVVAGTGPGHLDAEDDQVTVGGTVAASGRAERAHQRAAVLGRADDIRGTVGGAIRGDAKHTDAQHNGEGDSARARLHQPGQEPRPSARARRAHPAPCRCSRRRQRRSQRDRHRDRPTRRARA